MSNKEKKEKKILTPEEMREGRDERGKFKKGNNLSPGAGGNPIFKKMHQLRQQYLNCVGPEDMAKAYKAMFAMIADGDPIALKLFFEYAMGKPMDQEQLALKMGENYFKVFQFFVSNMKDMGYNPSQLQEFVNKFDAKKIMDCDKELDKC